MVRGIVVCCLSLAAALILPGAAFALDAGDSISLSAPSSTAYAGYPFSFSGSGTVDGGDAGNYGVQVLFTPSSSAILQPSCPTDYGQADTAIKMANGGTDVDNSALGVTGPGLVESGAYTWTADVNGDVVPTVTTAGTYVACAYLVDDLSGETFAVSAPVPFTVHSPESGAVPLGFGGPLGTAEPSDVTLKVAPAHVPIRAPGDNQLDISGRYSPSTGTAGIVLTVKPTAKYNGCAPNDEEDTQIAPADGGAVLTQYEQVTTNAAGAFKLVYALNFKRHFSGTAVLCAYLIQGAGDDLAVGYDRFVAAGPAAKHKRTHRHKPKRRKRSRSTRR